MAGVEIQAKVHHPAGGRAEIGGKAGRSYPGGQQPEVVFHHRLAGLRVAAKGEDIAFVGEELQVAKAFVGFLKAEAGDVFVDVKDDHRRPRRQGAGAGPAVVGAGGGLAGGLGDGNNPTRIGADHQPPTRNAPFECPFGLDVEAGRGRALQAIKVDAIVMKDAEGPSYGKVGVVLGIFHRTKGAGFGRIKGARSNGQIGVLPVVLHARKHWRFGPAGKLVGVHHADVAIGQGGIPALVRTFDDRQVAHLSPLDLPVPPDHG